MDQPGTHNLNNNEFKESFFKIIVIEDDEGLNRIIQKKVGKLGYVTQGFGLGEEALKNIGSCYNEILLVDYRLPDCTGMELIEKVKNQRGQEPNFIMMTGFGDEKIAVEIMKLGACDYIVKDSDFLNVLIEKIKKVSQDVYQKIKLEKAESDLRKNTELLTETGKIAFVGGWEMDPEKDIFVWTKTTRLIHDVDDDFVPDLEKVLSFFPGKSAEKLKIAIRNAIEKGLVFDLELPFTSAKGNDLYVRILGRPEMENKKCVRMYGIFQNITRYKNVELELETTNRELLTSEQQLKATIKNLQFQEKQLKFSEQKLKDAEKIGKLGHVDWVVAEQKSYWSDEVFAIYERNIKQGVPGYEEIMALHQPEDAARLEAAIKASLEKAVPYEMDLVSAKLPSGVKKHLHIIGQPVKDINGKVTNIKGIVQDITARKKAELAQRKLSHRIQAGLKVGNFAWWEIELPSGKIIFDDLKAEMLGYSPDLFNTYHDFMHLVHKDDREVTLQAMRDCIEGRREIYEAEYRIQTNEGDFKWFHDVGSITERNNEKGNIHVVGIIEDVTRRKIAENKLLVALEKAKESDRLKTAFLANMSHEIRTPMNGILGFINLLNNQDLSEDKRTEYTRLIAKSSNRLLNTINDLIDISRIESKQVNISKSRFMVNDLLKEISSFFMPEAEEKNIKISINPLEDNENPEIYSDREKLYTIISNLVDNAIKFSNDGVVTLGYAINEEEVEFFVEDSGRGIPRHRQEAIFNRFEQADVNDNRGYEGSGLGLSIAKAYTEYLEGSIWVESEPGKGSKFIFNIRCNTNEVHSNDITEKLIHDGEMKINEARPEITILVAEDDLISYKYIQTILEINNIRCLHAENGQEAIDLCRSNGKIDIILMDIKMPVKDGFLATKEIREFNQDVLIIAQTAYAMKGDKEKALEAGCNDYLAKPIMEEDLMKKINTLLLEKTN